MNLKTGTYLDYNATTPVDKRVVDAMIPYFSENFANAGSDHVFGWNANEAVDHSRIQIAKLVQCKPNEIVFTSGATEAANIGLLGYCRENISKGHHIISCKTEHKAVLDTLCALENEGFEVSYLEVDSNGSIDLDELEETISSETILICLMIANNETGQIHPIESIAKIAHSRNIAFVCDLTQAVGKIPIDLKECEIDMGFFSAHKLYGPKGVGALYINKRKDLKFKSVLFGGGQEMGMRPGTLNVPGIVGFGKAAEIASAEMESDSNRIFRLRERLEARLVKVEGLHINSENVNRLPNTTNVTFSGLDGNQLIKRLNKIAVSRGSACNANTLQPSHVLKAMGLSDEKALASLRISLGKYTEESDIDMAMEEIAKAVEYLKTAVV